MDTHMFWAYGNFSTMEIICANSFIKNGYKLFIWTYGDIKNVPSLAIVENAREIISEDKIFLNSRGSYAGFSDLFRYHVLNKVGGLYVDTDVVAMKPADQLPNHPFLVTERPTNNSKELVINGNVIFNPIPQSGNIIDLAAVYSDRFPKDKITWGEIGPGLLSGIINSYKLHNFEIKPPEFANHFDHWNSPNCFTNEFTNELPYDAHFIHFYNEMWRASSVDKDGTYHVNSIYEILKENYFR